MLSNTGWSVILRAEAEKAFYSTYILTQEEEKIRIFLGVYFRLVVCLHRLKKIFCTSILPKHKEYVYIVLQGQAYRLAVLHFSLS